LQTCVKPVVSGVDYARGRRRRALYFGTRVVVGKQGGDISHNEKKNLSGRSGQMGALSEQNSSGTPNDGPKTGGGTEETRQKPEIEENRNHKHRVKRKKGRRRCRG